MNFSVPFTPLPSVLLDMFPSWGALHVASAQTGLGIFFSLGLVLCFLWVPKGEVDEDRKTLREARIFQGCSMLVAGVLSGVFGSYFFIPALLGLICLALLLSFRPHAMPGGSFGGGEGSRS